MSDVCCTARGVRDVQYNFFLGAGWGFLLHKIQNLNFSGLRPSWVGGWGLGAGIEVVGNHCAKIEPFSLDIAQRSCCQVQCWD